MRSATRSCYVIAVVPKRRHTGAAARALFNRRWDPVQVFMTQHERNRGLEGQSVAEIGRMQNKSVLDAFLDLSLDEDLQTCEYSTHLLGHWVREQQAMPLEEAVCRLTGKTALMHDLHDRGFIAAGKAADITIFDPDTIASKPREPVNDLPGGGVQVKREAVGIDHVIVNGTVLFENGELTGALPGQIIRGPLYQASAA